MDECSLGIHQVEFVIESSPGFGDGSGVTQHADRTLNLSQVTAGNHGRRLIIDTDLNINNNINKRLRGRCGNS